MALQCPLLLPTDLASLLHDIGQADQGTLGIVQESKGFLEPGLGLSGALLMPGYVTEGDRLVVRAYSTLSSLVVQLRTQLLMNTGRMVYWGAELRPKNDVTKTEKLFVMPESVIRTAAFSVTGATVCPGQCYVSAFLTRADDSGNVSYATLIADYVTSAYQPSFPQGPLRTPDEGPGYQIAQNLGDFDYQFPAFLNFGSGISARLEAFRAALSTDATVGNRLPSLNLFTGGFLAHIGIPLTASAPLGGRVYNFILKGTATDTVSNLGDVNAEIPESLRLDNNGSAYLLHGGAASGPLDFFGNVRTVHRQWLQIC